MVVVQPKRECELIRFGTGLPVGAGIMVEPEHIGTGQGFRHYVRLDPGHSIPPGLSA